MDVRGQYSQRTCLTHLSSHSPVARSPRAKISTVVHFCGQVAGLFRVSSDLCAGFGWGDRSNQPPIGEKVFKKMISEESRVEVRESAKDK